MEFCSYNHPQVCHNERECPVCDLRKDLDKQIGELKDERDSLQQQMDRMEAEEPT